MCTTRRQWCFFFRWKFQSEQFIRQFLRTSDTWAQSMESVEWYNVFVYLRLKPTKKQLVVIKKIDFLVFQNWILLKAWNEFVGISGIFKIPISYRVSRLNIPLYYANWSQDRKKLENLKYFLNIFFNFYLLSNQVKNISWISREFHSILSYFFGS